MQLQHLAATFGGQEQSNLCKTALDLPGKDTILYKPICYSGGKKTTWNIFFSAQIQCILFTFVFN